MHRSATFLGLLLLAPALLSGAPHDATARGTDPTRLAYHLRVVRVSGEGVWRGAALSCGRTCGKPIVLPSEEAWGTPAQLSALARALGGERADAVTGFIVLPEADGNAAFDATVYPGEVALGLQFAARPMVAVEPRVELALQLRSSVGEAPLAEVRIVAAPERTVAIAAPSPVEDEWVVLAVTTLDSEAAEARAAKGAPTLQPLEEGATRPELVDKMEPLYPPQAKSEGREGKAVLQAVIDAEGAVRAVTVVQVPTGSEDFAAAAVEAVQNWRYRPALTPDGRPVPVYLTLVIEFRLRSDT